MVQQPHSDPMEAGDPHSPRDSRRVPGPNAGSFIIKAEAVSDYTPESSHKRLLPFRKGDTINVTTTADNGWWEGELHGRLGRFPSSHVSLISFELNKRMLETESHPESPAVKFGSMVRHGSISGNSFDPLGFAYSPYSSRKNSQFSYHSTGSSEPTTDFDVEDEILRRASELVARDDSPGLFFDRAQPHPLVAGHLPRNSCAYAEGERCNHLHMHLSNGADWLDVVRESAGRSNWRNNMWSSLADDANLPVYPSMSDAVSDNIDALMGLRDGRLSDLEVVGRIQALGITAGIPIGTYPSLCTPQVSAKYRLLVRSVLIMFITSGVDEDHGTAITNVIQQVIGFADMYCDTWRAKSPYAAANDAVPSARREAFEVNCLRHTWEKITIDGRGNPVLMEFENSCHLSPATTIDSTNALRDTRILEMDEYTIREASTGSPREIEAEEQDPLATAHVSRCEPEFTFELGGATSIAPLPLWPPREQRSSLPENHLHQRDQFLELETYLPTDIFAESLLKTLLRRRALLAQSIQCCLAVYERQQREHEGEAEVNLSQPSFVSTPYVGHNGNMFFAGVHPLVSMFKSVISIVDSVDVYPLYKKLCMLPKYDRRRKALASQLNSFFGACGHLYDQLLSIDLRLAVSTNPYPCLVERAETVARLASLPESIDSVIDALVVLRRSHHPKEYKPQPAQEIVFGPNDVPRGGTKRALVEQITLHNKRNSEVLSSLLLTFSAYMSETELATLLIERFDVPPSNTLVPEGYQDWVMQVQLPIRLRVVNAFRLWLDTYWLAVPRDVEDRRSVLDKLAKFLDRLTETKFSGAPTLVSLFQTRRSTSHQPTSHAATSGSASYPEPIEPDRSLGGLTLDQVNPLELARQMTLVKSTYYAKVSQQELLWRFIKGMPSVGNSVGEYIDYWNEETGWISAQILQHNSAQKRAERICYFVKVGEMCRKLNNFSTLMSIVSALYSAGIYRLKNSWHLVPKKYIDKLEVLRSIMNSSQNFTGYRDLLAVSTGPAIPFFGVMLMDLQFAYDGNADTVPGRDDLIHFGKWTAFAAIIQEGLRFQRTSFHLKGVHDIQTLLKGVSACDSLNDQYDLSLSREPRQEKLAR